MECKVCRVLDDGKTVAVTNLQTLKDCQEDIRRFQKQYPKNTYVIMS